MVCHLSGLLPLIYTLTFCTRECMVQPYGWGWIYSKPDLLCRTHWTGKL